MLRDTFEDINTGYFNIPSDFLDLHGIDPSDVGSEPYRAWVEYRVQQARDYFKAGKGYLAQVKNIRCRIAGYAYIGRFEATLNAIERDEYHLRHSYRECKSPRARLRMSLSVLSMMFAGLIR
jgi:phytoene/squalene synthetase